MEATHFIEQYNTENKVKGRREHFSTLMRIDALGHFIQVTAEKYPAIRTVAIFKIKLKK